MEVPTGEVVWRLPKSRHVDFSDQWTKLPYSAYRDAPDFALKINTPAFWRANLALAAATANPARGGSHNALHDPPRRPDLAVAAREELGSLKDEVQLACQNAGTHAGCGASSPPSPRG